MRVAQVFAYIYTTVPSIVRQATTTPRCHTYIYTEVLIYNGTVNYIHIRCRSSLRRSLDPYAAIPVGYSTYVAILLIAKYLSMGEIDL